MRKFLKNTIPKRLRNRRTLPNQQPRIQTTTVQSSRKEQHQTRPGKERKLGKKFIDKGASLVIGSHVHCIQGFEKYNKGLICYSLGNFIFGDGIIHRDKLISNFPKNFNKNLIFNLIFTKKKIFFS